MSKVYLWLPAVYNLHPMNLLSFSSPLSQDLSMSSSTSSTSLSSSYKVPIGANGLTSPMKEKDDKEKESLSDDLREPEKLSIIQYRHSLAKRTKEKKAKAQKTLKTRLSKYKKPIPARITEDTKREKSIRKDDVSPII